MKKASSIMYLIGKITAIIEIVCNALMIFVGYAAASRSEEVYQKIIESGAETNITGPEQVKQVGIFLIVACVVAIVLSVVILTLLNKAKAAVDEGRPAKGLHISMIVLGVLTNLFILLGGAFALGASENSEIAPQEPQQPQE